MGARLRYLFGEVGIGLRRNLLMTLATILTVTVTVAMVGSSLLVQRQVDKTQELLYANVELFIFLVDDISPTQQTQLESDLRDHPVVADVIYESKEEAYANAQELFDPVVLQDIEPDTLPASFRVQLTDPEEFGVVSSLFSGRPEIERLVDNRDVYSGLFAIMGGIQRFVQIVALATALAAVALIATTIRLTAFARREQTAIMKLVGATNWYIQLPFIAEGMVTTAVGALAAFGLLLGGVRFLVGSFSETISAIPFIGVEDVFVILPILLIGGAVVSVLALRRFLAV